MSGTDGVNVPRKSDLPGIFFLFTSDEELLLIFMVVIEAMAGVTSKLEIATIEDIFLKRFICFHFILYLNKAKYDTFILKMKLFM